MKRFCFALDLVEDEKMIAEYERIHAGNAWPEVLKSITDAGIIDMQIYRTGNRMFMIMDTTDDFDAAKKASMDATNPIVQQWEQLMWKFQQALPWAKEGEKWVEMKKIFGLK